MNYSEWLEYGIQRAYLVRYNKSRDKQLKKVKNDLKRAFTPSLISKLPEKIRREIQRDVETGTTN